MNQVPVLIALGAFLSIVTAAIFKSIKKDSKLKNLKRTLVILISLVLYIVFCFFILQQKISA
jgi:hypothetical protein